VVRDPSGRMRDAYLLDSGEFGLPSGRKYEQANRGAAEKRSRE
jgi:hypothetical protein